MKWMVFEQFKEWNSKRRQAPKLFVYLLGIYL